MTGNCRRCDCKHPFLESETRLNNIYFSTYVDHSFTHLKKIYTACLWEKKTDIFNQNIVFLHVTYYQWQLESKIVNALSSASVIDISIFISNNLQQAYSFSFFSFQSRSSLCHVWMQKHEPPHPIQLLFVARLPPSLCTVSTNCSPFSCTEE